MMGEPVDQTPEDDPLDAILAKRKKQEPVDPLDAILAKRKAATPEAPAGHVEGIASTLNHALPFADDIQGMVGALRQKLSSPSSDFGKSFTEARDASRQRYSQYTADKPFQTAALQVPATLAAALATGGESLVPASASLGAKAVGMAAEGAGVGGLYGLGNSQGTDLTSRLEEANREGKFGAIAGPISGAVSHGLMSAARSPINAVAEKFGAQDIAAATGPNRGALKDLTKRLTQNGADVAALTDRPESFPVPENMGKGQDRIEASARERQASGNEKFPKAMAQGAIQDEQLDAWLTTPQGQRASKEAEKRGATPPVSYTNQSGQPIPLAPGSKMTPEMQKYMGIKEVGGMDVKTLHELRKAVNRFDDREGMTLIDGVIDRQSKDLQTAIQDYAARSRHHEMLTDANDVNQYLGANSSAVPPHARKKGEPYALDDALTGTRGVQRQMENYTPEDRQAYREVGQDKLGRMVREKGQEGAFLHDTGLDAEDWQRTLFGSPEAYEAWKAGQLARPIGSPSFGHAVADNLSQGYTPYSLKGAVFKAGRAVADASEATPHLQAPGPLSQQDVLKQALLAQGGAAKMKTLQDALRMSGVANRQSVLRAASQAPSGLLSLFQ